MNATPIWRAIKELDHLVLMYYKHKKHVDPVSDWISSFDTAIITLNLKYATVIPREYLLENISCRLVEKRDEKLIRAHVRRELLRDLK